MTDQKVIAVAGATGAQGGGLVRADVARSLNPSLHTFDQWLATTKNRISLQ